MTVHYAVHLPKVTEIYSDEDLSRALEAGATFRNNEYDISAVFHVEDGTKTPIAFFWNGQKFIPQE